ncbi:hypothetical protein GCM10022221_67340 [Actinocorallia aurea]
MPNRVITNTDRAAWAALAVDAFKAAGTGASLIGHYMTVHEADADTVLPDLLCDLNHLAYRSGSSWEALLEEADRISAGGDVMHTDIIACALSSLREWADSPDNTEGPAWDDALVDGAVHFAVEIDNPEGE